MIASDFLELVFMYFKNNIPEMNCAKLLLLLLCFGNTQLLFAQIAPFYLEFYKLSNSKYLLGLAGDGSILSQERVPDKYSFLGVLPDGKKLYNDYPGVIFEREENGAFKKCFGLKLKEGSWANQVQLAGWNIYFLVDNSSSSGENERKYSLVRWNYGKKKVDTILKNQRVKGWIDLISISPNDSFLAEVRTIVDRKENETQILSVKKLSDGRLLWTDSASRNLNERFVYGVKSLNFDEEDNLIYLRQNFEKDFQRVNLLSTKNFKSTFLLEEDGSSLIDNGFTFYNGSIYQCFCDSIVKTTIDITGRDTLFRKVTNIKP